MKLKFNWGHGIALFIASFVAFLSFMVAQTFGVKVDLVADNYYEQELAYQGKIDRIKNFSTLNEPVQVRTTGGSISIAYPPSLVAKGLSGTVACFRPSDNRLDRELPLQAGTGQQQIDAKLLKPGIYQVQLSMEAAGEEYYYETSVYVTQ